MLLGQLEIDCIKKIKTDDNVGFTMEKIADLKEDREYKKYFNNIIPSLNDGIRRLALDEKIPYQSVEIPITGEKKEINHQDLSNVHNIYRIKSILYEDTDGQITTVDYFEIAQTLKLNSIYRNGKFIVLYAPSVRPLTEDDPMDLDLETLGLSTMVCGYLTYFVKAELYEKVEPDLAIKWRSYAEQYKAALSQEVTIPTQQRVREVYKL